MLDHNDNNQNNSYCKGECENKIKQRHKYKTCKQMIIEEGQMSSLFIFYDHFFKFTIVENSLPLSLFVHLVRLYSHLTKKIVMHFELWRI